MNHYNINFPARFLEEIDKNFNITIKNNYKKNNRLLKKHIEILLTKNILQVYKLCDNDENDELDDLIIVTSSYENAFKIFERRGFFNPNIRRIMIKKKTSNCERIIAHIIILQYSPKDLYYQGSIINQFNQEIY